VRRAWLAPVLIVISIVLQLTVLNGLRLPGGGVPDVVLVVVAALAVADGPLAGLIAGFAAGLCLDLAPPGSLLVGQYALVFCLAGWAAGRLGRIASKSPLWSAVFMAIVVAAAEVLSTAIGLVLQPAQVTAAEIRAVLPATIGYDLVLCPFVLYLVVVAGSLFAEGLAAAAAAGGVRGVPTPAERARKRRQRQHRPHQPRLVHAAARTGDGWLSTGHDRHHGRQPSARTRARLRPASGMAGSASGLRHPGSARSVSHTPPSLRLAGGRRGDGAIGNSVGSGSIGRGGGRHPGMLAGAGRQFRPRGGQPGGSATRQHGAPAGLAGTGPARAGRGRTPIRFGGHRGDGALGRALGSAALTRPSRPAAATFRLRTGTSRSALTTRSVPRVVPKVKFKTAAPAPARRSAAAPRFRRSSSLASLGTAYGLVSGGVLDHGTFRTPRRRAGLPRLRLAAGRRASGLPGGGMLGGSGRSPLRGPRPRIGKQPRFGYGRRSLLSILTGGRAGRSWLARKRAGSRSGGSLIGKWTGGAG